MNKPDSPEQQDRPDRPGRAVLLLTTTADEDSARALARTLVEEGLAACVTRSAVRSVYRWGPQGGDAAAPSQDPVCEDDEVMVLVKTSAARADRTQARILELHPYDCPELIRMDPDRVDATYLSWLLAATGGV